MILIVVFVRLPEDDTVKLQTFGQRDRKYHDAVVEAVVVLFQRDAKAGFQLCGLFRRPADDGDGFKLLFPDVPESLLQLVEESGRLCLQNGYRLTMADHRIDLVAALGSPLKDLPCKAGNFYGIPVTFQQKVEAVLWRIKHGFFELFPVVHAGLVADVLGDVPHNGKVTVMKHLLEDIIDGFTEILSLIDKDLAEYILILFLEDPAVNEAKGGRIVNIGFPF